MVMKAVFTLADCRADSAHDERPTRKDGLVDVTPADPLLGGPIGRSYVIRNTVLSAEGQMQNLLKYLYAIPVVPTAKARAVGWAFS